MKPMLQAAITTITGWTLIFFLGIFFKAFVDPASEMYGQLTGASFYILLIMLTLYQKEEDSEVTENDTLN